MSWLTRRLLNWYQRTFHPVRKREYFVYVITRRPVYSFSECADEADFKEGSYVGLLTSYEVRMLRQWLYARLPLERFDWSIHDIFSNKQLPRLELIDLCQAISHDFGVPLLEEDHDRT